MKYVGPLCTKNLRFVNNGLEKRKLLGKILTWLQGFLVIFLYLVWFSLCSSLFWELRDKFAILTLKLRSHVTIFIYRTNFPCCSFLKSVTLNLVAAGVTFPKSVGPTSCTVWVSSPSLKYPIFKEAAELKSTNLFIYFLFIYLFSPSQNLIQHEQKLLIKL